MAKDPADTQKIWTNKHCSLQLVSLCNKTCGKKKQKSCSVQGSKVLNRLCPGIFPQGKDLQGTRSSCQSLCHFVFPRVLFFFKVAAFLVSDPIVLRMENPHTD